MRSASKVFSRASCMRWANNAEKSQLDGAPTQYERTKHSSCRPHLKLLNLRVSTLSNFALYFMTTPRGRAMPTRVVNALITLLPVQRSRALAYVIVISFGLMSVVATVQGMFHGKKRFCVINFGMAVMELIRSAVRTISFCTHFNAAQQSYRLKRNQTECMETCHPWEPANFSRFCLN